MATRRAFLQAAALGGAYLLGRRPGEARADPLGAIQGRMDGYCDRALTASGANIALVAGVVAPEINGGTGQIFQAGGAQLTNPFGEPLPLDARTPFEIGSISKIFSSGIYYMLHGPYSGTLGSHMPAMGMSQGVAALALVNLAIYQPGLAQDNQGGVYPRWILENLETLFRYLGTYDPPFPPGTCYAYSNLGWSLLAMAALGLDSRQPGTLPALYAQQLAAFCRKFGAGETRLFSPELKRQLPRGHRKDMEALPPRDPYRPTEWPHVGAGGVISTGADMMRFLLYNMGRLPGGLDDPALAYQQTRTFHANACSSGRAGPTTSYGWFHAPMGPGQSTVLSKNGGVAGYSSWMGFARWQGTGAPSPYGVFVLSNGHDSTKLGRAIMRQILGGEG
jgi:CubicO group peptidase (beta-lactamase class C family)